MDKMYEYTGYAVGTEDPHAGDSMPLLVQLQVWLHLLICPDCARAVERFELTRDILRSDFLPPAPGLEDPVMAMIALETDEFSESEEAVIPSPGGLSTRGWVIAGLIILVSLATAFFGMDFNSVARAAGMSFLLPVGIIIGIVLTSYGALFIGSHLKELSERFGL
jgi:hypothetical protein